MGIKTVPQPPYCPDLAPSDFQLFPKLRAYRYETIEEMKEAVTKVIDTLTQEDNNFCDWFISDWIYIIKFATVVKGNPTATVSIAFSDV